MADAREHVAQNPRVVTVVLNTNKRDDTLECLASLQRQDAADQNHVVVLDNRSADGSAEAIAREFPAVEVITIARDRGYAGNNNVGVRAALARGAEWVLVLNEDTVLDPECLSRMLRSADREPKVGIVGPMVFHHDEPKVVQSAGGRLTSRWKAVHIGANALPDTTLGHDRDVDWVSGCAIMLKRDVLEQIGLLDERFYYYWEETEWCVRARRAGWRVLHVPTARLWHKGVRRDYRPSPNVTYYNTRNRFLLLSKHGAPAVVRCLAWIDTTRTLLSWTMRPRWRDMKAHRDAMLRGALDYLQGRWGPRAI
jgi:GT2 family glycosyltransferase